MTIGLLPIRTPLGRSSHRHGLSVLRWAHHRTSDDELRLMIRIHPHQPEENRFCASFRGVGPAGIAIGRSASVE